MAFDAANQVSKAQREYIEGIFETYQKEADFLKYIEQVVEEVPTNYRGRLVSLETKPNPSLSFGSLDGGDLATPGNPTLDNLTITYVWMNSGLEQTYGAILNNNKETVDDPLQRSIDSTAQQFSQWLNYYASGGDGTTGLATASANYSGGTPTIFTANGATDFFGATRIVDGMRGYIYDSTGTTQRAGTVGTGVLTVSSHTATAITFSSNAPSDFISGDIFVPEGGNTTGVKGVPYITNNTGNYFNKSRSSVTSLKSTVITASAALSAALINRLYSQTRQRSGRASNDDLSWMTLAAADAQWEAYYDITTTSPQSHYFQHTGAAPNIDVGGSNIQFTWFGSKIGKFFWLRANEMYMLDLSTFKMAVLKKVGQPVNMPASEWLQKINGTTSLYAAARQQWMDFAGDIYSRQPHKLGKLASLDCTNRSTQKATYV